MTPIVKGLPTDLLVPSLGGERSLQTNSIDPFFERGRKLRTFAEIDLDDEAVQVFKVVIAKDTVLTGLDLIVTAGQLTLATQTGGTEGGTFDTTLPIVAVNTMSGVPAVPVAERPVVTTGGTLAEGTTIDLFVVKAAVNANFAQSVRGSSDERGVPAGTYYFVVTASGASTGVIRIRATVR